MNINVLNIKPLLKMSVIVSCRADARGLNKIINVEPVIKCLTQVINNVSGFSHDASPPNLLV